MFFKFRLADRWGCSLQELEDRLPQCELPYWYAYFKHAPFGGDVIDTQLAQIAAIFAEAHRNPKKKLNAFKVSDFKLAAQKPIRQSKGGVREWFKSIVGMLGKPDNGQANR